MADYKSDEQKRKEENERIRELSNIYGLTESFLHEIKRVHMRTLINKYITVENKVKCIGFLISGRTDIFEKMYQNGFIDLDDVFNCIELFPSCMLDLPQNLLRSDGFVQRMFQCVKPAWYDFLPSFLANNPEIKKICNRNSKVYTSVDGTDKKGYDINWENENGELLVFFSLEGNFPINSKLDYYKLFKEYLESQLSVPNFCKKYGITPISGFHNFLKRIEAENLEEFTKVREVKDNVQKRFYALSKERAEQLSKGELSLEEFFSIPEINFHSSNIRVYFGALSSEGRNQLAKSILEYVESNSTLMSANLMRFLTCERLKPSDSYNTYIRKNLYMPQDAAYIQMYKRQITKITGHEKSWKRDGLYGNYIIGEQKFPVDDSVIDQAYAYASDNGYHISFPSLKYLCKQIAAGQISYSQETSQAKAEMINSIIALIREQKTIEDYIALRKQPADFGESQMSTGAKH